MKASELQEQVHQWAIEYGINLTPEDKKNGILRKNIEFKKEGKAQYFGYIRPEEPVNGGYSDFSFVIFPQEESSLCIVGIGVGSDGFNNDRELSELPGFRRRILNVINEKEKAFCKTTFADIETSLSPDFIRLVDSDAPALNGVLEKYKTLISACQLVNTDSEQGKKTIKAILATYASIRNWPSTMVERKKVEKAIEDGRIPQLPNEDEEAIKKLLDFRKYIILQGAPGTGKTRIAKKIAKEKNADIIFTQFHAETSYSDFVYGIKPKLNSSTIEYEKAVGKLYEAILKAEENKGVKDVYLIIDEINRANLANILGPLFYLFEFQMEDSLIEIDIGGGKMISKIPDNLFVIATMNTADRSLAVVDFALRRRFAWYNVVPKAINSLPAGKIFFQREFNKFSELFELFASDEELNLQPGQGYFVAKDEKEMRQRMIYELMPLMKEYFGEGLLLKSKDSFVNYFYIETGKLLYK